MSHSNDKIFPDQIKILYERAPSVIPVNVIIGGILCLFLVPVLSDQVLFAWWSILFVVSVVRYIHVKYTLKNASWMQDASRLSLIFSVSSFFTGLIWCSSFFLFAFSVPDLYLIFIVFALGGMSVGAIASKATSKAAFFGYTIPMMIPPTVTFLFMGSEIGYPMFGMMAIYSASISITYLQSYKLVAQGIKNQLEKDELIQHLKISKQHLELANEKVLVMSHTDDLTQLANRRYLDMMLEKEGARAIRSKASLAFVMIDIDFFKDYNDTFGHQQGDYCLEKIADLLRQIIKRPGDFVARYGGEEFCVLLPETDIEGARRVMKEYQEALQTLKIPAGNTTVSAFVTVSVGIASCTPQLGDDVNDLVAAADAALYNAKEKGRNRIEVNETFK